MSKVKSRSHHNVAHLQPLTNVPIKYQLHTLYSFRDIAQTRLYRTRSLQQGQRSYQGHIMMMHTYSQTNVPTKYTSYTLQFPIYPRQDFIGQGHYDKVKGQINVTP